MTMKVKYKGFEIEVKREKTLGGWEQVYYTSKRLSDGWYLTDSFSDDEDALETHIQCLKEEVDDFLANPRDYVDPDTYEDMLVGERDEAQKLAAWLFQSYGEIVFPKGCFKALQKRYPYLKEVKGFYPEVE